MHPPRGLFWPRGRALVPETKAGVENEQGCFIEFWRVWGCFFLRGEEMMGQKSQQLGFVGPSHLHWVLGPCLHLRTITWARQTSWEGGHRLFLILYSLQDQCKEGSKAQHLKNTHCEPQAWVGHCQLLIREGSGSRPHLCPGHRIML